MILKTILTNNCYKLLPLRNRSPLYQSTSNICLSPIRSDANTTEVTKTESFATMFRNSAYVQLGIGGVESTLLKGKIVQMIDNSLFIDYGGKFHCVCKVNDDVIKEAYINKDVCVKLLDPELSARFLGSYTDTTLLESKATYYSPRENKPDRRER